MSKLIEYPLPGYDLEGFLLIDDFFVGKYPRYSHLKNGHLVYLMNKDVNQLDLSLEVKQDMSSIDIEKIACYVNKDSKEFIDLLNAYFEIYNFGEVKDDHNN